MTDNDISFGLVLTPTGTGREWVEAVRKVEQQGWTSLLIPDTLWTPSPFPALAAAAAVTTTLRLRTWVIAAPLRSPAAIVRESATLQQLSDGRFELGIGTGRPDAEREAAILGVPWGTAGAAYRPGPAGDRRGAGEGRPDPTDRGHRGRPADAGRRGRVGRPDRAGPATDGHRTGAAGRRRSGPLDGRRIAGLSLQVSGLAGRLPSWLSRSGLDPADARRLPGPSAC